jgi:hypothetical protein
MQPDRLAQLTFIYIHTPEKFESIDLPLLPLCDESYSRWHGRRSCVVVVCRAVLWNLFIIVQAPRMYYNGTAAALFVYVRTAKRHIAKRRDESEKKIVSGELASFIGFVMAASSRAAEIMASVSVCVSASSLESMPAMRNMWHYLPFWVKFYT